MLYIILFSIVALALLQPWKKRDVECEKLFDKYKDKVLVEVLKTKINHYKVFWVGRSKFSAPDIRVGIEAPTGRKFFIQYEDLNEDPRLSECILMSPQDADKLEVEIREKRKIKPIEQV